MDETVYLNVASLRKAVLLQSAAASAALNSYPRSRKSSGKALFSATIKEEEGEYSMSEDCPSPSPSQPHAYVQMDTPHVLGLTKTNATDTKRFASSNNILTQFSKGSSPSPSKPSLAVISTVAAATSKLFKGLLHRNRGDQHGVDPLSSSAPVTSVARSPEGSRQSSGLHEDDTSTPSSRATEPRPRPTSADSLSGIGKAIRSRSSARPAASGQPAHPPYLVRLLDGDDVGLALHALKLSSQVYDNVFNPQLACSDPAHRRALHEAVGPLYDKALATARAIHHPALQSLVKEAVRRYGNPSRGAPDDVLRLILELLAAAADGGSGAGAAATVVRSTVRDDGGGHSGSAGSCRAAGVPQAACSISRSDPYGRYHGLHKARAWAVTGATVSQDSVGLHTADSSCSGSSSVLSCCGAGSSGSLRSSGSSGGGGAATSLAASTSMSRFSLSQLADVDP